MTMAILMLHAVTLYSTDVILSLLCFAAVIISLATWHNAQAGKRKKKQ